MRYALIPAMALGLLASACGFTPLYAPQGERVGAATGRIVVDEVKGKSGYVLKYELDKLFAAGQGDGAEQRLTITLAESVAALGFNIDQSASRSNLVLTAKYLLADVDGKEIASGVTTASAAFDVPTSAYGEISAQNAARERAAEQLAEQVRAQIALKLAALKAKKTP